MSIHNGAMSPHCDAYMGILMSHLQIQWYVCICHVMGVGKPIPGKALSQITRQHLCLYYCFEEATAVFGAPIGFKYEIEEPAIKMLFLLKSVVICYWNKSSQISPYLCYIWLSNKLNQCSVPMTASHSCQVSIRTCI